MNSMQCDPSTGACYTQGQLVSVLPVMHNFICLFDPKDKELNEKHMPEETSADSENMRPRDDRGDASKHRDDITQVMWRDYKARSHCR
jgi:hypothetical protein